MHADVMFGATCLYCGDKHISPKATREEVDRYINGELVQRVWPDWSVDEREIACGARTGMFLCPTCWDWDKHL